MLMAALIVLTAALAWFFWIRPILRLNPKLAVLIDQHDTFLAAVADKLAGIKQKLTTAVVMISGVIVSAHDFIAPLAAQAGFNAQQLLPKVPAAMWPLITMALIGLVQLFRNLSDKREG